MASSEFVTGVQHFVVGREQRSGTIMTDDLHIPHAVPAAEAGANRPRAVCGAFVDQVLSDVPFPPAASMAMPQPPCPDCLDLAQSKTSPYQV
jgi:hypothetical protein